MEHFGTLDAARMLGLSVPALKYHVRAGNIVPQKIGHSLVFSSEMLRDFGQKRRKVGRPAKK